MKKRYKIILLMFTLIGLSAKGQHEFLAKVTPSNLSYSTLNTIPGVMWILDNSSAIDENHHQYFFVGTPPAQSPNYLYTINTLTGNIIYSPLLQSNITAAVLEYDNSSDTLYGLFDISSSWYFGWIDYTTAAVHLKNTPSVSALGYGSTTFDKNHHHFFFSGGVIDATTGNIINSNPSSASMVMYDNFNNRMYGLYYSNSTVQFDSIEVNTGILHHISNLPCVGLLGLPVIKALDEIHGRYFFVGLDSGTRFFSIDIQTGNVISNPIDLLLGNDSNLIEFQYDNVQDTLFALHWGQTPQTVANFQSGQTTICANDCIRFTNNSINATSWQWLFPSGTPTSSTDQNPQVCYLTSGIYNVTLIASNSGGSDTLSINNYITVNAAPATPVITQVHNDTLFCSTNAGYISYQWYLDSVLVAGATDTFLVISKSGNYNVEVTNANGCKISVGINVIIGLQNYMSDQVVSLSPNPVGDKFTVYGLRFTVARLEIYNVLGQVCRQSEIKNPKSEIDVSSLPSGVYFVQMIEASTGSAASERWVGRFVKE